MKKLLFLLAILSAFLTKSYAQNTQLIENQDDKTLSPYFFVQSGDSSVEQLPLLSTSADVNIAGVIADVKVIQVYRNTGKKPIEAIYIFPASTRAAVYGMTMTIGERILVAEIQKKEEARKTYEKALKEGKSASLLEQQRPNVFQMNVGNIMPGDTIIVELKYTELLIPTDGIYEFVYPSVVGPRYSNKSSDSSKPGDRFVETPYQHEGEKPTYLFDVKVNIASAVPLDDVECKTHNVNIEKISPVQSFITLNETEKKGGNRDYILKYRLTGNKIQSGLLLSENDKENFFLLMLQPPKRVEPKQIPPREFVFVIDVSGSMHGKPLDISKDMMKKLLRNLKQGEKFNVLLFSGGNEVLSEYSIDVSERNIQKAIDFINAQKGYGGTELLPALKRVFDLPKEQGKSRTIVILTDGFVDVEEEAFDLIRSKLNQSNVFAFGIGSSVNRFLIEGLARVGMGEPFIITKYEDKDATVDKFRKYIESPVMTDIKVEYDGFMTYDVEPLSIPDVLAERPILVYGKWMGHPTGNIIVTGISGDTRYKVDIGVQKFSTMTQGDALKYLWARNKIAIISDYNSIRNKEARKNEITDLGLKYNLLTNFTSFVAVDYISRNKDSLVKVQQPLPMPEDVTDFAVGRGNLGAAPKLMQKSMVKTESEVDNPLIPTERKTSDRDPGPYDYVAFDKRPEIDLEALKKNIVYPEIARVLVIEGKVQIRAMIGKDGKVEKSLIEYSDNSLLDNAAKDAVEKAEFTPAESNGKAVVCWVSVPVQFKIDDKDFPMNFVREDFRTTPSGLKFKDIVIGNGEPLQKNQKVTIHYKGYLSDGTKFEETLASGKPLSFVVGKGEVIKAFDEGLLTMKVGGKRVLEVPSELAYGHSGLEGKVPPDTKVYFEVELIGVN
ncbi:MAG: TonB family protein [Bacteroidetes bacterium]|nr:MAG: TonB family protein [Bacteroidota bacterium]